MSKKKSNNSNDIKLMIMILTNPKEEGQYSDSEKDNGEENEDCKIVILPENVNSKMERKTKLLI